MIPSSLLSAQRIRPFTRWSELSELSVPGPVVEKMPRVASRAMVFAFPTAVAVTLALTLTFAGGGASAYAAPPRHGADYAAEAAKSKELGTALADYQESNYPVALREFKAEAERGNRIAQFDYAMMLLNGEGTDPDLPNALIWLQKAAHAGMSHAQFIYGQLYDSGQVVAEALRFGLDRGEPRTLEEVGEYFNVTRERIRQIEARDMSKLRHPSADTGARDLLAV